MKLKTIIPILAAAVILVYACWCPGEAPATTAPAASADGAAARAVVESMGRDVIRILRDTSATPSQRAAAIKKLARRGLDFDTISRLALGREWAKLPDDKRDTFRQEFEQHILNTFARLADNYGGEEMAVISERSERDGDWTVHASVFDLLSNGSHHDVASVDFRMRATDSGWKAIDLSTNGISMLGMFRAQFQSMIASGEGIDPLLKTLHEKNAAAAASLGLAASTAPSAPAGN